MLIIKDSSWSKARWTCCRCRIQLCDNSDGEAVWAARRGPGHWSRRRPWHPRWICRTLSRHARAWCPLWRRRYSPASCKAPQYRPADPKLSRWISGGGPRLLILAPGICPGWSCRYYRRTMVTPPCDVQNYNIMLSIGTVFQRFASFITR